MKPLIINDWVPVEERLPTAQDADAARCVMVWHVYQGAMLMGWHLVKDNRFVSHWTTTPPAPEHIDPKYKAR